MTTAIWIVLTLILAGALWLGARAFWKWFSNRWDADEDERHDAIIQGKKKE
jgi:hypothetical protein